MLNLLTLIVVWLFFPIICYFIAFLWYLFLLLIQSILEPFLSAFDKISDKSERVREEEKQNEQIIGKIKENERQKLAQEKERAKKIKKNNKDALKIFYRLTLMLLPLYLYVVSGIKDKFIENGYVMLEKAIGWCCIFLFFLGLIKSFIDLFKTEK